MQRGYTRLHVRNEPIYASIQQPETRRSPLRNGHRHVFTMGQGGSMFTMDEVKGWVPGIDKIAFSNDGGNSYVANPFSDNAYGIGQHSLVDQYDPGMGVTMVYAGSMMETYFGVAGNLTFDDSDVTTAV